MTDSKIYLGRIEGTGPIYLTQHRWDCDWYWAFGYLGNKDCHFHISSLIDHPGKYDPEWHNVTRHFTETWLTQDQWWILRDLFIQAYAIRKCADSMLYGGHQTMQAEPHRIKSESLNNELNGHLETLLKNIWTLLCEWRRQYENPPAESVVGDDGVRDTVSMPTTEEEQSAKPA